LHRSEHPARQHLAPALASSAGSTASSQRFAYLLHRRDAVLANPAGSALGHRNAVNAGHDTGDAFVIVSELDVATSSRRAAQGEVLLAGDAAALDACDVGPDDELTALQAAVDLACRRGATRIGLSPTAARVSNGGLDLRRDDCLISAGTALTAAGVVGVLDSTLARLSRRWSSQSAAVLGASTAQGRVIAALLAERAARLLLIGDTPIGRVRGRQALLAVAAQACCHLIAGNGTGPLAAHVRGLLGHSVELEPLAMMPVAERLVQTGFIVLSTDRQRFGEADVGVIASATGSDLQSDQLRPASVLCDLYTPRGLPRRLADERPDVLIVDPASYETIPEHAPPGLLGSRGLPAALVETMLLAATQDSRQVGLDDGIAMDEVGSMSTLAARHGFRLAPISSYGVRISEKRWASQRRLRAFPVIR
jgi:predicted amino acid dehydrogenase